MTSVIATVALLTVACIAAITDLRTRRIPNWLTLPAFITALAIHGWSGWSAFGSSLAGAGIGLAIGATLVAMGGMGGGDAKLLTVVGAFLGPQGFGWAMAYTGIAGGVFALIVIAHHRMQALSRHAAAGSAGRTVQMSGHASRTVPLTIPYGVPIAIGATAFLWLGALPW